MREPWTGEHLYLASKKMTNRSNISSHINIYLVISLYRSQLKIAKMGLEGVRNYGVRICDLESERLVSKETPLAATL
jgi:hypothetical protein